jgi:GDP-mannose 6-dehydrogenase
VGELSPPAKILLLGLAFKIGTDDLRESPAVDLARKLLSAGFDLSICDQKVDAAKLVGQNLGYAAIHLPNLSELLVSEAGAQESTYDLVVDTVGKSDQLKLVAQRIVKIDTLP